MSAVTPDTKVDGGARQRRPSAFAAKRAAFKMQGVFSASHNKLGIDAGAAALKKKTRELRNRVGRFGADVAELFGAHLKDDESNPFDCAIVLDCKVTDTVNFPDQEGNGLADQLVSELRDVGLIVRVFRVNTGPTCSCCCWSRRFCLPCWTTFHNDIIFLSATERRYRQTDQDRSTEGFLAGMDVATSAKNDAGAKMSQRVRDACLQRIIEAVGVPVFHSYQLCGNSGGVYEDIVDDVIWLQNAAVNAAILKEIQRPCHKIHHLTCCCGPPKSRKLESGWSEFPAFLTDTAIDHIRIQFGDKMGWYFLFIKHVSRWLVPIAVLGIGVSIADAQLAEVNLHNIRRYPAISTFSLGVLTQVWFAVMLRFWERKEAAWQLRWGQVGMEEYEATVHARPAFKGQTVHVETESAELVALAEANARRRELRERVADETDMAEVFKVRGSGGGGGGGGGMGGGRGGGRGGDGSEDALPAAAPAAEVAVAVEVSSEAAKDGGAKDAPDSLEGKVPPPPVAEKEKQQTSKSRRKRSTSSKGVGYLRRAASKLAMMRNMSKERGQLVSQMQEVWRTGRMDFVVPKSSLSYIPGYCVSVGVMILLLTASFILVCIVTVAWYYLVWRPAKDADGVLSPCEPRGFPEIPLLDVLPDIAFALINDVLLYEVVLKLFAPKLTNLENHQSNAEWNAARWYKAFVLYAIGPFAQLWLLMLVFVPLGDKALMKLIALGDISTPIDSRPNWFNVKDQCSRELPLHILPNCSCVGPTCQSFDWRTTNNGVPFNASSPLWNVNSSGLTEIAWTQCWRRRRSQIWAGHVRNFTTTATFVHAVVTMMLPFLLNRAICCGGCKDTNFEQAVLIEVAVEDDVLAAKARRGKKNSRGRSAHMVRSLKRRRSMRKKLSMPVLRRLTAQTQGECGLHSAYDVDDNWMMVIRCLAFILNFISVFPAMPALFICYFLFTLRTDPCRLMYQRSKPNPEPCGGIGPYKHAMEAIADASIWINFAVLTIGIRLRPSLLETEAYQAKIVTSSASVSENTLTPVSSPVDISNASLSDLIGLLIIGFCAVLLQITIAGFRKWVPASSTQTSFNVRYLKLMARYNMLWWRKQGQTALDHAEDLASEVERSTRKMRKSMSFKGGSATASNNKQQHDGKEASGSGSAPESPSFCAPPTPAAPESPSFCAPPTPAAPETASASASIESKSKKEKKEGNDHGNREIEMVKEG